MRFMLLLTFLVVLTRGQDDYADYAVSGSLGLTEPPDINNANAFNSLVFIRELKNTTKESGESLKVKCEVEGEPPARSIKWFKNEAPLQEEQGRVKVKSNLKGSDTQWSILRFRELETLDTGFFRCEASNGKVTVKSTAVIKVNVGSGKWKNKLTGGHFDTPDYGHVPETFPDAFQDLNSLTNGIDGLPANIEFQGRSPADFASGSQDSHYLGANSQIPNPGGIDLPRLKPNEKAGRCQKYLGTACKAVVGDNYVFVSADQHYVEQKLAATFSVIMTSPDMSPRCSEFATAAICHSTFPLCDRQTQKPRKLCRDECEVLEQDICKKELAIAKSHPMIGHQMVLPECGELPQIGSRGNHNCVKMNIPKIGQLIKPHSCFTDSGEMYRGTHSMTTSGHTCKPWREQIVVDSLPHNLELIGGHNYCRNPSGAEQMSEPWCFTDDHRVPKEVCGIPQCSSFNLWLYVVVPAAVALVFVAVIICVCCMVRQIGRKKPLSVTASSPRSFINPSSAASQHNYSEMEMNSLLPSQNGSTPCKQQKVRAREFPISAVRFIQEMGDGVFGKVYRGELGGIVGGVTTLVAVKTLKPGANQQTRGDFHRESELMADLRHPNIVCLLGVVMKDDPQCLIFEYMPQGDLHEFLIMHSPRTDIATSMTSEGDNDRILDHGDMSYITIQIAAGMEYLSSHHFVHRDLAARNCLVGENLTVKISDFGLSRDIYAADYYRMQTKSLVPIRWMPPESIFFGKFTTESDIWSFGIIMWEIYSYGLQPYYGFSNQEVIEMIRSRQLLPCPEDCPSRMYAFMVECWHELPNRRPTFPEIHARLRQWEGMSVGYQSTSSTANHSTCGQSNHSGSQHSSTGPSNNTGSTNLSNNQFNGMFNNPGGYAHPFQHKPLPNTPGPPVGLTVQMGGNGGLGHHTKLVGQVGPYSSHGHSSSSNMYAPLTGPLIGLSGKSNCGSGGQQSVASLQMV